MQQNLLSIGILVVFIGFILIFIGSLTDKTGESKVAFVGLQGPIPFGFGNDKRLFLVTFGIAVALMIGWILFNSR